MKKLFVFPLILLFSTGFSQYSISEIPEDGYLNKRSLYIQKEETQ
ncbi:MULTISPECIES: hypothetical protein [Chryseobacterium]|nr:hypothetical protein [Chryseobacterium lathyri]